MNYQKHYIKAENPCQLKKDVIIYKKVRVAKKAHILAILELYVPKGAFIYSPYPNSSFSSRRKMRVSEALVCNAYDLSMNPIKDRVFFSAYTSKFKYMVDDIVIEPKFSMKPRTCEAGIHGFFDYQDAINYML